MKSFILCSLIFGLSPFLFAAEKTCWEKSSALMTPGLDDVICFEELQVIQKTAHSYTLKVKDTSQNLNLEVDIVEDGWNLRFDVPREHDMPWDFRNRDHRSLLADQKNFSFHQVTSGRYKGTGYSLRLSLEGLSFGVPPEIYEYNDKAGCGRWSNISLYVRTCDRGLCDRGWDRQVFYCKVEEPKLKSLR